MGMGGVLGVEWFSPARWFPLICGRGHEQGRPARVLLPFPSPLTLGRNAEERLLTLGTAEGWEGRLVGLGTALVPALVAPVPGRVYMLNKYLLDDLRDKRGPARGGPISVFSRQMLSLPCPPRPPYLRGGLAGFSASPRFRKNLGSPGGPRESCSAASEPIIWFLNPQAGRSVGAGGSHLGATPPRPNVGHGSPSHVRALACKLTRDRINIPEGSPT